MSQFFSDDLYLLIETKVKDFIERGIVANRRAIGDGHCYDFAEQIFQSIPKDVDGRQLPNGANEHHVRLMRSVVKDKMGVKASGGIRSARTVIDMLEAGASRIGTSNSVNIIELWDESVPVRIPDYKL